MLQVVVSLHHTEFNFVMVYFIQSITRIVSRMQTTKQGSQNKCVSNVGIFHQYLYHVSDTIVPLTQHSPSSSYLTIFPFTFLFDLLLLLRMKPICERIRLHVTKHTHPHLTG